MIRLNESASQIHSQLHFSANEPLTELVLADYIPSYGPEVWFITYTIVAGARARRFLEDSRSSPAIRSVLAAGEKRPAHPY